MELKGAVGIVICAMKEGRKREWRGRVEGGIEKEGKEGKGWKKRLEGYGKKVKKKKDWRKEEEKNAEDRLRRPIYGVNHEPLGQWWTTKTDETG